MKAPIVGAKPAFLLPPHVGRFVIDAAFLDIRDPER
jgi:hypothetical protein